MAIALVSIVTLFVCMSAAFLLRQTLETYNAATGTYIRDWQPLHLPFHLLWADTIVLIASCLTLELARRQAVRQAAHAPALRIPGVADDHREFPWLPLTVVLGFAFLAGQVLAWTVIHKHELSPADASLSFFYILTGAHAFHLAAGLIALLYAVTLNWKRNSQEQRRIVVDVTAWYWHVIGGLWLYLFAVLSLS
jgi:cytochrome c oxidase subunit 3